MTVRTKVCKACKKRKPASAFHKSLRGKYGLHTHCKICRKAYDRKAYLQGDKKAKQLATEREKRNFINAYKQKTGCKYCPENEPIALDFHHRDMKTKEFDLATMLSKSWQAVLDELEKCDVVCSNCHRKLHAGILSP